MSKHDRRTYPGLFASPQDVAAAQRAAAQWAEGEASPERAVADEREQRFRVFARSILFWVLFGLPLISSLLDQAMSWLFGMMVSSASTLP